MGKEISGTKIWFSIYKRISQEIWNFIDFYKQYLHFWIQNYILQTKNKNKEKRKWGKEWKNENNSKATSEKSKTIFPN